MTFLGYSQLYKAQKVCAQNLGLGRIFLLLPLLLLPSGLLSSDKEHWKASCSKLRI